MASEFDDSLNVFGEPLLSCSNDPVTGFFRDGCCNTSDLDFGQHTVCIEVTTAFLEYSRFKGNDLMTGQPELNFPGLMEGDRWCLCAERWLEAYHQNMAPKIHLMRTHRKALEVIPLALLKQFAIDLN